MTSKNSEFFVMFEIYYLKWRFSETEKSYQWKFLSSNIRTKNNAYSKNPFYSVKIYKKRLKFAWFFFLKTILRKSKRLLTFSPTFLKIYTEVILWPNI